MTLHELLDFDYGADGDDKLQRMLADEADPNRYEETPGETPLHVATRRRRLSAVKILLEYGAAINALTAGGKTAYAHAIRRGFDEIAAFLLSRGADSTLNAADRLAVAMVKGQLDEAREILADHPDAARTGNPEEDRLLADLAGRNGSRAIALLIASGADLAAPGLDSGTPLHQAAWFGQPGNAQLLIEAGAPLDIFDTIHHSSPLGWAVHGSRYSGEADKRQDKYVALVSMLLTAGSSLSYPGEPESDAYYQRLLTDATPRVAAILKNL